MLPEAPTSRFRSYLIQAARVADAVALALLFVPTRLPSIRLGGIMLLSSGVLLLADPTLEKNSSADTTKLSDEWATRLRLGAGGISVAAGLLVMFWPS